MPQVTLYLDGETRDKLKAAARRAGTSQSKWVTDLIRKKTRTEWPDEVVALSGAWKDLPVARGLRQKSAKDAPREPL